MTIKIKVGRQAEKQKVTRKIPVKKALDGSLLFFSHPHINISVSGDKKTVLTFAKDGNYTDDASGKIPRQQAATDLEMKEVAQVAPSGIPVLLQSFLACARQ